MYLEKGAGRAHANSVSSLSLGDVFAKCRAQLGGAPRHGRHRALRREPPPDRPLTHLSPAQRRDFIHANMVAINADPELPELAKRLARDLWDKWLNWDRGVAFPGVVTMCRELGSSPTQIRRATAALVERGYWGRDCGHPGDRVIRPRAATYWPLTGNPLTRDAKADRRGSGAGTTGTRPRDLPAGATAPTLADVAAIKARLEADPDLARNPRLGELVHLLDQRTGVCWLSAGDLGERLRCSERTTRRDLDQLKTAGLVIAEHRPGLSTLYRLQIPGNDGTPNGTDDAPPDKPAPEPRTNRSANPGQIRAIYLLNELPEKTLQRENPGQDVDETTSGNRPDDAENEPEGATEAPPDQPRDSLRSELGKAQMILQLYGPEATWSLMDILDRVVHLLRDVPAETLRAALRGLRLPDDPGDIPDLVRAILAARAPCSPPPPVPETTTEAAPARGNPPARPGGDADDGAPGGATPCQGSARGFPRHRQEPDPAPRGRRSHTGSGRLAGTGVIAGAASGR